MAVVLRKRRRDERVRGVGRCIFWGGGGLGMGVGGGNGGGCGIHDIGY